MKVDLHVHTSVSDGCFAPEAVLELALRAGIRLLSITDHDAIDGHDRALERLEEHRRRAPATPIALLAGVEFSTSLGGDEVHILGYFAAGASPRLRAFLLEAEASRAVRIEEAAATLTRLGYPVSFEAVRRLSPGRTIGRSHLARALVEGGIATTTADAFRRFLATERGVVPRSRNRAEDVVRLIREEGGFAALAHPRADQADAILRALNQIGLEGIELYGKRRRGVDQLYLETLAGEYGLIATAGSDWHGRAKVADLEGVSLGLDRMGPFLERLDIRVPG